MIYSINSQPDSCKSLVRLNIVQKSGCFEFHSRAFIYTVLVRIWQRSLPDTEDSYPAPSHMPDSQLAADSFNEVTFKRISIRLSCEADLHCLPRSKGNKKGNVCTVPRRSAGFSNLIDLY